MTEAPYLLTLNVRPISNWIYGGADCLTPVWPPANHAAPRVHSFCSLVDLVRDRQHDLLCGLVSARTCRHDIHGFRLP